MSSLLIVTSDTQLSEQLSRIPEIRNFRIRSVTTLADAEEWLKMQKLDVLIIDARNDEEASCGLLSYAWIKNPMLFGSVLSYKSKIKNELPYRAIGAKIFQGENALQELTNTLSALPEQISLVDKTYFSVLVIEDLDSPRDIICSYIEALGFRKVEGVKSAEAALKILRQRALDFFCVVTDINMPKMNGIEFIKEVRSDSLISNIPVIALTSVPTIENVLECLKAGVTGFLAKPLQKKALRSELEKAKRIALQGDSPRLAQTNDHASIEQAIKKLGVL